MISCSKSKDGRHNFPPGGDCLNGCGVNQTIISGHVKRIDKSLASSFRIPAKKEVKGIHSALHLFVDDLRKEFGETATKGVGSFSYYLGFIKRLGVGKAYQIMAEIRQSGAHTPKKLFWWRIGQELKKRRELKKFLFNNMYKHYRVQRMCLKAKRFIRELFFEYVKNSCQLPPKKQQHIDKWGIERVVCDYISEMTDRYALDEYKKLFDPYEKV